MVQNDVSLRAHANWQIRGGFNLSNLKKGADEPAHLRQVSLLILRKVSCSLYISGLVIAAGPLSSTPASRSLAHDLSYANVPGATPSRGAPVFEQKLLRGASEYSAVWLKSYLGLARPSALVGGLPMRRTLYFKTCACLLANQAYQDQESHELCRQGGDVLEPREYGLPNMGVSGRFLQPLCSSVALGPPMPLIMHAGVARWWTKGCESFLHLNH